MSEILSNALANLIQQMTMGRGRALRFFEAALQVRGTAILNSVSPMTAARQVADVAQNYRMAGIFWLEPVTTGSYVEAKIGNLPGYKI